MTSVIYFHISNFEIIDWDDCVLDRIVITNLQVDLPKNIKYKIEIIDDFDLFHSPAFDDIYKNIDREEMKYYDQYFYLFCDQYTRWRMASTASLEVCRNLFFEYINYWTDMFQKKDVQKIYFYEDPHRAYDFIAYIVAKKYNIDVNIFSYVNIGYRAYIKKNIWDDLSSAKKLSSRSSNLDLIVNLQHTGINTENINFWNKFFQVFTVFNSFFRKFLTGHISKNYTKFGNHGFIMTNTYYGVFLLKAYLRRLRYVLSFLLLNRSAWCSPEKCDAILFLHYFPERTSNPVAYPLEDQLMCLKIILSCFSTVGVKEHPVSLMLSNSHRNRCAHSPLFARSMLNLGAKFVKYVSPQYRGTVVTLNGTVGLEYALRGNKVIAFGNPWYGFLPNVHVYTTFSALNKFINSNVTTDLNVIRELVHEQLATKTMDFQVSNKYKVGKNGSITEYMDKYFLSSASIE